MDRLLDLFAGILDDPGMDLVQRVQECALAAAAVGVPPGYLEEFIRFVESSNPRDIIEIYKTRGPTIGQQLYGEGYGRSMLLLDLQKRYRKYGFECGDEPADSLAVLLRFLSECDDPTERGELSREVLVPGLEAMITASGGEESPAAGPFLPLLRALSAALREQVGS
jgi:nitrate reductase assembly molybdenum cofactor insertion protein NarJ